MSKKYGVAIWWLIFWTFSLLLLSALQIHTSHTSTRTPHTHVWQFLFTSGRMSFRYFFLTIDSCCNNFTLAFISIWLLGQYQSNVSARGWLYLIWRQLEVKINEKKNTFCCLFRVILLSVFICSKFHLSSSACSVCNAVHVFLFNLLLLLLLLSVLCNCRLTFKWMFDCATYFYHH